MLLSMLVLLCAGVAWAQTQGELNDRAGAEYKKADADLNRTYAKVAAAMQDPAQKRALLEAEEAWIKFRDAHARCVAYENKGGTMYPMVYAYALTDATTQRTKQLKLLLEQLQNQ
jgi:uncharacterized protein YecT (DUF1311 family)